MRLFANATMRPLSHFLAIGMSFSLPPSDTSALTPDDWAAFRAQAHRMLDDMLDYQQFRDERPLWRHPPQALREAFSHEALPQTPQDLADIHQRFMQEIVPHVVGNTHSGFMGWVHGGGTAVGMLAEMLAGGLNVNAGGRNQMALDVEWQIVRWMRELCGFPETASGLFVTGSSMANFLSILIARHARYTLLNKDVRQNGLSTADIQLVGYTSQAAHGCLAQAFDLAGLGIAALRRIPVNADWQMDVGALKTQIAADREAGFTPFFVAGTAGTVDVGAIDPLPALADVARAEGLWFHVDGAFGALGVLSARIKPLLQGLEQADSLACDFHKWGQVPYDAGFLLVRDGEQHKATFATPAAYLRRENHGLAGGSPWPCDFGPDLSRGFRALKTWFTLQTFGQQVMGEMIERSCALAHALAERIDAAPQLQRCAPVTLNIVCFVYRFADVSLEQANALNAELAVCLQEGGLVAPSTTILHGQLVLRAALVNHRTSQHDIDTLLEQTLRIGTELAQQA